MYTYIVPRVHNIEESILIQYDFSKMNAKNRIYGFSTNIKPLKGVNKQDLNSA